MKTLTKEHGFLNAQGLELTWAVNPTATYGNWRLLSGSSNAIMSNTYFDLAGMSMKDKTLFFDGAGVQIVNAPAVNNGAAGDTLIVTDLMSSSPLTDAELSSFITIGNFAQPGAKLTFDETIYARNQVWGLTLNEVSTGYMVLLNESQFGSMSPTASDRVYSYRIITAVGLIGQPSMDSITIYPGRHILRAEAKEEPDHEYIMRLLRSYQLQQEPDED